MKNCLFEDPVFKSEREIFSIVEMKKILKEGDPSLIRKRFFLEGVTHLNLTHVVELQIKKHSGILNHRKNKMLRYLLK